MPDEGTRAPTGQPQSRPPGWPTTTSTQQPPWWRRPKIVAGVGGAVVLVAAAGTVAALASRASTTSPHIPAARSYASAVSVLAAMDRNGAVCSGVGQAGQFADCSAASNGDTVVGMFSDHADALAYADGMVTLGLQLHTATAEVVGPNWVVNTSPAFAGEVVDAIGGQIITKANASPPPVSAPAPAWPADVFSSPAQG
jgi:hypothetical protein